jgi:hypothetical protein
VRKKRKIKKKIFKQARNTMLGLVLRANQPRSIISCTKIIEPTPLVNA